MVHTDLDYSAMSNVLTEPSPSTVEMMSFTPAVFL